jgi:hypothetical protein
MMPLILIAIGGLFYTFGELFKKELKYAMGVLPAIIGAFYYHSWFILWAALTYFIACEIGYGENNPLTKIVGKRAAITIHGTAVGLASYPFVGLWCILGGIISGVGFFVIAKYDDDGKIVEPFVAIGRSIVGLIILGVLFFR